MNDIKRRNEHDGSGNGALAMRPAPRCPVETRPATLKDVAFIDQLQKMHSHMVGWFPNKQIEKNIEDGNILIAEGVNEPCPSGPFASSGG